jgi:hypothetical protein
MDVASESKSYLNDNANSSISYALDASWGLLWDITI